jgi:hypothetical protein
MFVSELIPKQSRKLTNGGAPISQPNRNDILQNNSNVLLLPEEVIRNCLSRQLRQWRCQHRSLALTVLLSPVTPQTPKFIGSSVGVSRDGNFFTLVHASKNNNV